ncbi:hypothetical protein ECG_04573 [Echinococcus granulosus]|uniref:Uncharacterized protein n=1 Tax=Echinococcus granulosus TaxID=6210 RepID=A0A068WHI7_ECHGR|nr:hypothetical protein ECG_04573 [Echinococcus granulosus]CDS17139.1 hypothetical protein EgrG_000987100 [Echinococcus granulosus]
MDIIASQEDNLLSGRPRLHLQVALPSVPSGPSTGAACVAFYATSSKWGPTVRMANKRRRAYEWNLVTEEQAAS